jgi:thioredoxin 1
MVTIYPANLFFLVLTMFSPDDMGQKEGFMSEKIVTITSDTWGKEVSASPGIVLIYFWATWCGHCKMYAPVFEALAQEYAGKIRFAKLNCDENADVANKCQVRGTPTMLIYKNGKQVDSIIGGIPKEQVQERLDKLLKGPSGS